MNRLHPPPKEQRQQPGPQAEPQREHRGDEKPEENPWTPGQASRWKIVCEEAKGVVEKAKEDRTQTAKQFGTYHAVFLQKDKDGNTSWWIRTGNSKDKLPRYTLSKGKPVFGYSLDFESPQARRTAGTFSVIAVALVDFFGGDTPRIEKWYIGQSKGLAGKVEVEESNNALNPEIEDSLRLFLRRIQQNPDGSR